MELTMAKVCSVLGAFGSLVAGYFGGWNSSLSTLCILMVIDYITGISVALVFRKSLKSESGAYESSIGAKGLVRKIMVIVLVFVSYRIDVSLGTKYLKDGVAIAFVVNETLSILENAKIMGLPIPDVLYNGIAALKGRDETKMHTDEELEQ